MSILAPWQNRSLISSLVAVLILFPLGGWALIAAAQDSLRLLGPPRTVTADELLSDPTLRRQFVRFDGAAPAYHLSVLAYTGPKTRDGGPPPLTEESKIEHLLLPLMDTADPKVAELLVVESAFGDLTSAPAGYRVPRPRLHPVVLRTSRYDRISQIPTRLSDTQFVSGIVTTWFDRDERSFLMALAYSPPEVARLVIIDEDIWKMPILLAIVASVLLATALMIAVAAIRRRTRWLAQVA